MKAVAIVLDSVGLGYLPDAPLFGDEGADTLDHTVLKTGIALPTWPASASAGSPGSTPCPAPSGPGAGSAACGR